MVDDIKFSKDIYYKKKIGLSQITSTSFSAIAQFKRERIDIFDHNRRLCRETHMKPTYRSIAAFNLRTQSFITFRMIKQ